MAFQDLPQIDECSMKNSCSKQLHFDMLTITCGQIVDDSELGSCEIYIKM